MKRIPHRCSLCNQPLDEIGMLDPPLFKKHNDATDCIRALVRRVENLEYELLAKKLPDGLSRSSEPGPPSGYPNPVVIPEYSKK